MISLHPFSFCTFQISLADDYEELLQAYFRDFTADGVQQPHKLFTGSWRTPTAANYLGLSPEALDGSTHSYVLVKLVRNKVTKSVGRNLRLAPKAAMAANDLEVGNTDKIMEFAKHYGTHYISSVTIGDAIYQVFALTKEHFGDLKQSLGGRRTINPREWHEVYETYLAPWLVKETGKIRAASGDVDLHRFLEEQLRVDGQFGSNPNLVEGLLRNPANVQTLEELTAGTSAVVGLNFATLKTFFPNLQVQQFYDEAFATQSALWGVNI